LAGYAEPEPQEALMDSKPNPFDVLAQLKSGKEN
jgi:uncharacterized metal-binding protein YceD (DUF177 family)